MIGAVFAVRAELSRLLSVKDFHVPVALIVLLALIGSIAGVVMGYLPDHSAGYVRGRSMLPLQELALPIWCAALGALRAGERRLGVFWAVRLAVPHPVRALLAGVLASALLGAVVGVVIGVASVFPLVNTVGASNALAHVGRAAVVFGVVSVLGFAVGELLRNEVTVWVIVLAWCTVGERLLASIPHVGELVGPLLPLRNGVYFLFGDDNGAPYPWGPHAAVTVPFTWALAAVVVLLLRLIPSTIREREPRS